LNPLGLFLEPPGPLPTHFHTVYIAYSECLPTRVNRLAERTCFSQVIRSPQQAASLLSDVASTARELVPIGRSAVAELGAMNATARARPGRFSGRSVP
jgi:hypothetical protein